MAQNFSNPPPGRRLRSLIYGMGLVYADVEAQIDCGHSHLVKICNDKCRLTEKMAKRLVEGVDEFQGIRYQWLLAWDEFKTEEEFEQHKKQEREERENAIKTHNKNSLDYIAGIRTSNGSFLRYTDNGISPIVIDISGKEIGQITAERFECFRKEVERYASFALGKLIEEDICPINQEESEASKRG